MATIAKLATVFSGEGSSFIQTADKVDKRLSQLGSEAKKLGNTLKGVLFSALAVVGVAMTTNYVKGVFGAVLANYKLARSIGDTTTGIYALQQGLRDSGADTGILGEALLRLARNLASVQAGNSAFDDVLKRIGLNARELSKLPPSKALQAIAEQISRIEGAEQKAAIASQLFGEHAAELLPLLNQGAAGFEKAAEKAKAMGLAIGDDKAAIMQEMANKVENVKAAFDGVVIQLGAKFLPYLMDILDKLPPIETWFSNINDSINDNTVGLRKLIGFFTALGAIGRIIAYGIQNAFLMIAKAVTFAGKNVFGLEMAMRKLTGIEGPAWMKDAYDEFSKLDAAVEETIRGNNTMINGALDDLNNAHKVNLAPFKAIEKQAEITGKQIHKKLTAGGAVPIANVQADNFAKGLDVFNEFKTPIDKFNDRMTQLNDLVGKGGISWDTYAKATANAVLELEKAHEMNKLGFAAGVRGGTTEAYTTTTLHQQEVTMKSRVDPQKRVESAIATGNEIARKQLEELKRIAKPLADMQAVKVGRNP